jgi:hypothetical protein
VVEGLDDRTTPSVGVLARHALTTAHHHHHHHHKHHALTPAVLVTSPVATVQTTPPATSTSLKNPPAPTTLQSGIRGQVREGPISPVAKPGEPNDQPLAGAKIEISREGSQVKTIVVTSDANGNFSIALPPGDYILTPQPLQPGQTFPHPPPPQKVHV